MYRKMVYSGYMKTINDLLNIFGGTRATARALKKPTSTVHNWNKNGIPAKVETLVAIQSELAKIKIKVTLDQLLRLKCED